MDAKSLPDNPEILKKIILDFDQHIIALENRISLLQKALFGPSSEKSNALLQGQCVLPFLESVEPDNKKDISIEKEHDQDETEQPQKRRKKKGRKVLPPDITRVDDLIDLSDEEKICDCGAHLTRIGEEVSEKLDYIPASVRIIRTIRPKYACRECEGAESSSGAVKIAPSPKTADTQRSRHGGSDGSRHYFKIRRRPAVL